MKTQHTPGPWVVQPNNGPHAIYAPNDGTDHPFVCQVYFDSRANEETKQKQEANAKLISAAPELLEALATIESVLTGWNRDGTYTNLIEHAKTAMNKATQP